MRFEWDEQKNRVNIRKHGFDLANAEEVFAGPMFTAVDDREGYGEDRWIGIGMLRGRVVVVIFTERDDDVLRIISLRKALSHERRHYEQTLRDGLGTS